MGTLHVVVGGEKENWSAGGNVIYLATLAAGPVRAAMKNNPAAIAGLEKVAGVVDQLFTAPASVADNAAARTCEAKLLRRILEVRETAGEAFTSFRRLDRPADGPADGEDAVLPILEGYVARARGVAPLDKKVVAALATARASAEKLGRRDPPAAGPARWEAADAALGQIALAGEHAAAVYGAMAVGIAGAP